MAKAETKTDKQTDTPLVTHNVIFDNEDGTRTIKPMAVPEGVTVADFMKSQTSKTDEETK